MRARILAVCPYEALQELILDVARSRDDLEVTPLIGDISEGRQKLVERIRAIQNDYDILISRGSTMRILQQSMEIPVIEILDSVYDIMRIVRLLKDYAGKYALIGTRRTEENARMICEALGSKVDLFTLSEDDDVNEYLKRLKEEGYQLVIGGVTATTAARALGMNALLMTSSREAVSSAMDEAARLYQLTSRLRMENHLFETIVNGRKGFTAIFDRGQRLLYQYGISADFQIKSLAQKAEIALKYGELYTHIHIDQKMYVLQGKVYTIDHTDYVLMHASPCHYIDPGIHGWISTQRFSDSGRTFFTTLSGHSPRLSALLAQIQAYSEGHHPVALYGEAGVGKADIAYQLHIASRKKARDLIQINVSDGNKKRWEALLESPNSPLHQLGYSIYFFNMQDIPAYILRPLQEYVLSTSETEFGRLYFSWTLPSSHAIETDAFYRFLIEEAKAFSLRVPSLRERSEDIPSLLSIMISECNYQLGKQVFDTEDGVVELLQKHPWPFNFIQFRELVRNAVMMSKSSHISLSTIQMLLGDLQETGRDSASNGLDLNKTLEEINQDIIQQVLKEENYNYTRTAARLGISRSSLWRKTKQ